MLSCVQVVISVEPSNDTDFVPSEHHRIRPIKVEPEDELREQTPIDEHLLHGVSPLPEPSLQVRQY